MKLKPSVRLLGIKPELVLGLIIVESVFREHRAECVITTGIEGTHSHGSEHYTGLAVDMRLKTIPIILREAIVTDVRDSLGPDFDVLWEDVGTENEHLHIEYDPKEAY